MRPRGGFLVASYPAGIASHTWQWAALGTSSMAHKGMVEAARTLVSAALELLTDADVLAAVDTEFSASLDDASYQSPIPAGQGPFEFLARPRAVSSSGPARFRLLALSGSFCISFAAIFVRLADVSAATATLFRCLYAVPVLAILWWSSRAQDARTRRNRLVGLSSGLLLAADLSLWHEAILRIGAGLATVLVNVQVVFVASLAWLLYGEQPSRFALVTVPLILGGVALVSGPRGR